MSLNILIIGTGMYVCGRKTNGFGTILPALIDFNKKYNNIIIWIASRSKNSSKELINKLSILQKDMGTNFSVNTLSDEECNEASYLNILKKIKNNFSCAIVCTPDHTHFEITSELIKNNIPTLVVKPLAPTLKEVKNLISLQEKYKTYGVVEFHKRFDQSNILLKNTLLSNEIGKPLSFLVEYSQKKIVPEKIFEGWVNNTNIFQYLGIHYVDIIYYATNATPKRVMAIGQKCYLESKGIDNYDSIQCMVEWDMDGHSFSSLFTTNWIDPDKTTAMSDQKIKVIGTKGRYEADQKYRGIKIINENINEEPNPDFCSFYLGDDMKKHVKGYGITSIQTFLTDVISLKNKSTNIEILERSRPTFRQSIIPTMVIEAANQSLSENGNWITIGE